MVTALRDANDHFPHGAAGFHVGDGLGSGFQRKDLVHDRLDDTLVNQRLLGCDDPLGAPLAAQVELLHLGGLLERGAVEAADRHPPT